MSLVSINTHIVLPIEEDFSILLRFIRLDPSVGCRSSLFFAFPFSPRISRYLFAPFLFLLEQALLAAPPFGSPGQVASRLTSRPNLRAAIFVSWIPIIFESLCDISFLLFWNTTLFPPTLRSVVLPFITIFISPLVFFLTSFSRGRSSMFDRWDSLPFLSLTPVIPFFFPFLLRDSRVFVSTEIIPDDTHEELLHNRMFIHH